MGGRPQHTAAPSSPRPDTDTVCVWIPFPPKAQFQVIPSLLHSCSCHCSVAGAAGARSASPSPGWEGGLCRAPRQRDQGGPAQTTRAAPAGLTFSQGSAGRQAWVSNSPSHLRWQWLAGCPPPRAPGLESLGLSVWMAWVWLRVCQSPSVRQGTLRRNLLARQSGGPE